MSMKDAYLKLKKQNEKLNAVITFVEPDEEIKEGKLSGMAIALKDNISTKGIKTTAASNILKNYIPSFDATIVTKLKDAGAQIIAKTSMDELAMGGTNLSANIGPCYNPYDLSRISGGSSGGSAVLVASGAVKMAVGSDTGDSVRKPASFCGVVGVKPSYGRISRYGIIPYASSLDHVAYFTTNIKDAALSLEVLAGRDDLDMTSSYEEVPAYSELLNSDVSGKKILLFDNVNDKINNKGLKAAFDDVVRGLEKRGAIIEHVKFDEDLMRAIYPVYAIIANSEASSNHSNLDGIRFGNTSDGTSMEEVMINTRSEGFSSLIKERFVLGSYALNEENQERIFKKAQKVRRLIVEEVMSKLKDADILLAIASGQVAPKADEEIKSDMSEEYLVVENHMVIANFAGLPSLTQPLYFEDGLPIGISLTANPFKEQCLFDVALAIEEITGLKDLIKEDF